jgi:vacuolar-type H+-ATPase subunit H
MKRFLSTNPGGGASLEKREVLDAIRKAEADVTDRVAKAKADRETLLSAARQKAREMVQAAEGEAEAAYKADIEKARRDLQGMLDKLGAEGDKQTAVAMTKAEMRLDAAVELIMKEFERLIDV